MLISDRTKYTNYLSDSSHGMTPGYTTQLELLQRNVVYQTTKLVTVEAWSLFA